MSPLYISCSFWLWIITAVKMETLKLPLIFNSLLSARLGDLFGFSLFQMCFGFSLFSLLSWSLIYCCLPTQKLNTSDTEQLKIHWLVSMIMLLYCIIKMPHFLSYFCSFIYFQTLFYFFIIAHIISSDISILRINHIELCGIKDRILPSHLPTQINLSFFPKISSVQFNHSSCPTLCDPMNHSMPGLPVHHSPEFAQTHVHWVGDAIQPSHPLWSLSPPAPSSSQHQGLFKWVSSSHQVAKVLEFQLQHPMNTQDWSPSGWTGWISLQSKELSGVFSNTIVQKHQFLSTQLSL